MFRHITSWAACLAVLAFGAGGAKAHSVPATAAVAKAPATSKFLAPGELDASVILPPPPVDGSPRLRGDRRIARPDRGRTPERLAQAQHDAAVENVTAIAEIFGPALDLDQFPATASSSRTCTMRTALRLQRPKSSSVGLDPGRWTRRSPPTRRWRPATRGGPETSYPSGHATMGYTAAAVLAQLMPGNAQIVLARASDYAESRLICGAHFPSDTEASHVLATALVAKLMTKPEFQAEFAAAQAELTAAHIAP